MSNKLMSNEVVSETHGGDKGGKFVGPIAPEHGRREVTETQYEMLVMNDAGSVHLRMRSVYRLHTGSTSPFCGAIRPLLPPLDIVGVTGCSAVV